MMQKVPLTNRLNFQAVRLLKGTWKSVVGAFVRSLSSDHKVPNSIPGSAEI